MAVALGVISRRSGVSGVRLLLASALAAMSLWPPAVAVDRSKFRTCEQGSFCRRYKKFVANIEASGGSSFVHAIDAASLQRKGHVVTAKLLHVNDDGVRPLLLELRFYRDAAEGRCGVVRLFVTEEAPLHQRFRLREGDVTLAETDLLPDEVSLEENASMTVIKAASAGECEVSVRYRPFELDFSAAGRQLQRLNSRHLLNFESYRSKDAPAHKGLVDATDVDGGDLFEERFGGHSDSKPRGPAAVGLDVSFPSASEVVGLAEHAAKLGLAANRFSEPYRFFNLDVFEYALDVPMALYGGVPLVTAIHHWGDGAPATASGFFFANPSEGFVKVDEARSGWGFGFGDKGSDIKTWWLFESGVLDAFLFAGPTPQAVMQQYHTVTGLPPLPPISTLGKHQCRWNYVDVEDAVTVNKKFDQNDIPYDVLWLDIEHTDSKKYFTWHPSHFANPEVLLDSLEKSKRKLVTIIDPHIKRDEGYGVFTTLRDMDLMTKTKSLAQYDGWCWPGTSFYPDFCNPAMRDQWAKFFALDYYPHSRADLYTWNDMNEPSVFNGPEVSMPRDNLHKCHTSDYGVEHRDVHNVYGFYHHKATVQGQLERAPNVRPFVLTRSFFAGSHRDGVAVWTGDNMAKWDHLAQSVPMLLSMCLCGISFIGADVPGFFYDPEPELFKRWHQLGIWYPFYRGHAHLETKRREPWMFGEEITTNMREQISVRYQLLPVWYTLFAQWAMEGLPILRPLWYHNLDDVEAYKHQDNSYLVGEAILVTAVSRSRATKVDVYFPAGGEWFDYWDTQVPPLPGGQLVSVALQPSHVPVYVRKGHILFKKMRRRRSVGAMALDPYSIVIYGPSAKGHLYIDDGESHDYKGGAFIFDEFEFDGNILRERSAQAFKKNGQPMEAGGLPEVQRRRLHVERATFVGLPKKPSGARVVWNTGAQSDNLKVTSEQTSNGAWLATIKKPTCLLGTTTWSLELLF